MKVNKLLRSLSLNLLIIFGIVPRIYSQQCGFKEFRCSDGTCLTTEKLCNNVEDCPDGEDETGNENYDCSKSTLGDRQCRSDDFKCRFGGCVPSSQLCDSVPNCWGGTDESIELCSRRPGYKPPVAVQGTRPASAQAPTKAPAPITTRPVIVLKPRPTRPPPPPETIRPVRITTIPTTQKPAPPAESGACPPIEVPDGQGVSCFHQDLASQINCLEKPSPQGTTATINCKRFWKPPSVGSRSTQKLCEGGQWVGGNRKFRCDLECGDGGYPPIPLVAGGRPSKKGKWPWNVGLYEADPPGSKNFVHICGATLISKKAVLTAAHCVTYYQTHDAKNPRDLIVFLGKFNRSAHNNDDTVQVRRIEKIDVHADYNSANLDSDIAIIWLKKDALITTYVHPACLPNEDEDPEVGDVGTLAGWGSIGNKVYPEELQETELPIVGNTKCRESHKALENLIRKTTFCAGHRNGTSACDGDSGSGLVFQQSSKWLVQGVVSGGVPKEGGLGCDPHHYVAFTKVSKFRRWIDGKLDQYYKK